MLLMTLRRYHCMTKKPAREIFAALSSIELGNLKPKNALDMGLYPMPHHLLDDPIVYISEEDEIEAGRRF